MRPDFTITRIGDERVTAVEGGHRLSLTAYVAFVSSDRLGHFVPLVEVDETYSGWQPEDYQRANLRLHRAARDRLRDARVAYERSVD